MVIDWETVLPTATDPKLIDRGDTEMAAAVPGGAGLAGRTDSPRQPGRRNRKLIMFRQPEDTGRGGSFGQPLPSISRQAPSRARTPKSGNAQTRRETRE
jgi:hypothetical protein